MLSSLTQPFLPSISTLGPEQSNYQQQTNQQQQQHYQQQTNQQQQQQHTQQQHPYQHHHHQQQQINQIYFKQEDQHMLPSSTNLHHLHHHHPSYHQQQQLQHQQQQQHHHHHHPHPHHLIHRSVSSSTISGRPPPKTSRRQSKLNNLDRRRICEYAAAHPKSTQEDIALQWGIDRSSVSKILKYRDKWLSISPTARAAKVIKHRGGRFPQLESEVVRRCRQKSIAGGFLGDRTIKDLALDVSQEMGLGQGAFKASNGWLDAFKERAQIKGGRFLDSNRPHSDLTLPKPQLDLPTHLYHQNSPSPPNLVSSNTITTTTTSHQPIINDQEIDDLEDEEDEEEEEEEDDDDDDDDDDEEEEDEDDDEEEDDDDQVDEEGNNQGGEEQGEANEDREDQQENEDPNKTLRDRENDHDQSNTNHNHSDSIREHFHRSSTPSDSKHHHHHPTSAPTPPLSSSNSSTSQEDGSHGVKMDSLKSSIDRIIAPIGRSSNLPTPTDTHHDPSSDAHQTDDPDGMDGIEQIANDSGSADQTIVFKCPPSYTTNNNNSSNTSYNHHSNPYSRPFNNSPNDHHTHSFARRQASSNHSRSSSLSIGSLSQKSSVYGDDYHLSSPAHGGMKGPQSHQLSSYSSHPNFHPPPLRTTPVRRTFPSLRHAMSQPAFNSNNTGGNPSSPASHLGPMTTSSSSPQGHQYASFGAHPYSFSPLSAPPSQPCSLASRPNPRLELPPVCASRVANGLLLPHLQHTSQRDDAVEWPADEFGVGFDEALGALETVMRFLQDQPTSFATPRDYMVVGELFGRMKEKKQEMMTGNASPGTSAGGASMALTGLPRRLMTSSIGSNAPNAKAIAGQIRLRSASQHQLVSAPTSSPINGLGLVKEDSLSDHMEH